MFSSPFHAPWLLLGLAALIVPLIIHLLNRRQYDVVDWGAMQFLKISQATRRRLLVEEILLMAVRMALLAVLVLALAGPFLDVRLPAALAGRPNRDVVLLIDGSASMGASADDGTSPAKKAAEWADRFLARMQPGDSVAVLLAREQAVPLTGALSADAERARRLLTELPEPAGTCNWAESLRAAFALLSAGQNRQREVVLLSDNQRFGVADEQALFRWELLASELGLTRPEPPAKVRFVDLTGERPASLPNYALAELKSNRPIAAVGREVRFRGELVLSGQEKYAPPYRVHLEVDGKHVRDLPPPPAGAAVPTSGRVPFDFVHRFAEAGSHLVSVTIEPDPPPADRPAKYVVRDRVPGDNRQDFSALVIAALPVLLVDGEPSSASTPNLGTDFLRDALAPARDRTPAVRPRVVKVADFTPETLSAAPAPRVVVLHNVAQLRREQNEALAAYIAAGGGVLVSPGERCDAEWYNSSAYRDGEGWLPARMADIAGDESKPKEAARPDGATFNHPALEFFRRFRESGLADARFPRWWRLTTPGKEATASFAGLLSSPLGRSPFLVERAFRAGRVVISAVPLDSSWGSNLTGLAAFVPLAHELVYYLAGARSADFNLAPGQPVRFPLGEGSEPGDYSLSTPGGGPLPLSTEPGQSGTVRVHRVEQPAGTMLVYDGARESGTYTLHLPGGEKVYYVIPADAREGDLTPLDEMARKKVTERTGITFSAPEAVETAEEDEVLSRQDLWLYFLLGMIALLCVEVWMTRRLAMQQ